MEAVTQYMTKNNPVSKDAVKVMSEVHEEWKRRVSTVNVVFIEFHVVVCARTDQNLHCEKYNS